MSEQHQLPGHSQGIVRSYAPPVEYLETNEDLDDSAGSQNLLEYWHLLRSHVLLLAILTVAGAAIGIFIATIPAAPKFTARTTLEIQAPGNTDLKNFNIFTNSTTTDSYVSTQVRLMQTSSLIAKVVEKMQDVPTDTQYGFEPEGVWRWLRENGFPVPDTRVSYPYALQSAVSSLQVRSLGNSRIIEVSAQAPDPDLAIRFVNTLVQEYVQQSMESRFQNVQRTTDWLNRQVDELRRKVEQSEYALVSYTEQTGLKFAPGGQTTTAEMKLQQMQTEFSTAQADRVAKQTRYETSTSSAVDTLPEIVDNPALRGYEGQLADMDRQLAELLTSYTEAHYRVQRLKAQMASVQTARDRERANIMARIKNEYETAVRREKMLESAFSLQNKAVTDEGRKQIQYDMLKHEVDSNRQLYQALLQHVKEAGVVAATNANNVNVLDPGRSSMTPPVFGPISGAGLGMFSGLLLGVAFVVIRDKADRSVKTPGMVQTRLKLRELGVIPSANALEQAEAPQARRFGILKITPANGTKNEKVEGGVELVTWKDKGSLLAESYRSTLASILFSAESGHLPQVIVIASPRANAGKTTTVSNLGIALAEINRRVLLIDGDLRQPRLNKIFDVPNSWGLSDIIRDRTSIADSPLEGLARQTEIPNLYLLPSGPGTVSVPYLLYSPRMVELLQRLRREFDAILIDTPPALQFSDSRILARMADGVILVFRAGETALDTALMTRQRFVEDGSHILGSVLNDWNPTVKGYGYDYSYYQKYPVA